MRLIGLAIIFSVLLLGSPARARAQSPSMLDSARRLIADQATLDLRATAARRGDDLTIHEIQLTRIASPDQHVNLWRGSVLSVSHWPSYVVGIVHDQILPLGGFSAPALPRFAALQPFESPQSSDALRERATLLAIAADRSGAAVVVGHVAVDTGAATAVRTWMSIRAAGWPSDTVDVFADGRSRVALTVLASKEWAGLGAIWAPTAYVFLFDAGGNLLLWSSHEGEAFAAR